MQAPPGDSSAVSPAAANAADDESADNGDAGSAAPVAHPYGLIGLTIGLLFILVGAVILCVLVAGAAFGLMALALGWSQALDQVAGLRMAALAEDQGTLQAAGIVLSLVLYAALSALVFAVARFKAGSRWRDVVGWHAWHPFRRARLFWIIAVGMIAYSLVADVLISQLYPPSKAWVTLPARPIWAALFVALAVLFAPMTEELIFRGWLYTGLRVKIGVWAGILVSAVLFALAHWESTHIYALAVFPVGLALGYVREKTGSLKASISFHAIYNAAASALLVSGF